ncbi:MAG: 4Fe-4S dicluster domain-containing protein [bacterium]|nr:4Fe-4S dicluster domain-containing protein [bacterium]
MDSIYKQLAQVLDRVPEGYPETESGVELKILAKLFSPEEAELACRLELEPHTAKVIAQRMGGDERKTFIMLKGMTKKGLIEAERGEGGLAFKLMPFIVGFYERQNARIDEEFARLFEAYYKEAFQGMMTFKPSVHRVIPVETAIPMNVEVMPYERASTYIGDAKSWGVLPCICRVQKRLIGEGCDHSEENCLVISTRERAYDRTDAIRAISKEEALEILGNAGEEGLVHSTNNVQKGVTYICNCCTCSCGILRGLAEYGHLNAVGSSDFFAEVDEELCTGCGACIERCQFKALEIDDADGVCKVELPRCYGCGLCISACPTEALSLKQKSADEMAPPPVTESEWREKRSKAREESTT